MSKTATKTATERVLIGYIGVDSGQIMVGDPSYLDKFVSDDSVQGEEDYPYSFAGACESSADGGGVIGAFPHIPGAGRAVTSATAYGDGIYPVYQIMAGGVPKGIYIEFIADKEEE